MKYRVFLGFYIFFLLKPSNFSLASQQVLVREKETLKTKSLDTQPKTCLEHLHEGHTLSGIYPLQLDSGTVMVTF